MKKQFFRVKQLADQTFSRAGKTEALSDDLIIAEKRIEFLNKICQNFIKKIVFASLGQGQDATAREKRLRKSAEYSLAVSLFETNNGEVDDILKHILMETSNIQLRLADVCAENDTRMEASVLVPLQQIIDNDIPNVMKQKRNLTKLILDMDSARNRYQTALKHVSSSNSTGSVNKVDSIKDELEDLEMKVEQCRDALACEMFQVISKEAVLANALLDYIKLLQANHRSALAVLDEAIPGLQSCIENSNMKPVFGWPLEDHLRITSRKIAYPLEICVCVLLELGMKEEGLFRMAGGASKIRRLKYGFDANFITIETALEYKDVHVISSVLKSYFRELPEPLLTYALYDEWLAAIRYAGDENSKLSALWTVLNKLPQGNYDNLRYLIKFLAVLTKNQETNKMTPQNLAIVIAPNLIWSHNNSNPSIGENMNLANQYSVIVEYLVKYADWFFPGEETFYITVEEADTRTKKHARSNSADMRLLNAELTTSSESTSIKRCQSTTSLEEQIQNCPLPESPKPITRTRKNKPAPIPPVSSSYSNSPSSVYATLPKEKVNINSIKSSDSMSHSIKSHVSNESSPTSGNVTVSRQESFNFKEVSEKGDDNVENDKEEKCVPKSPKSKTFTDDTTSSAVSSEVSKLLSVESLNKILESKKLTKPVPAPRISLENHSKISPSDESAPKKPIIPEKPTSLQRPMSCTFKSFKPSELPDISKLELEKSKGPSLEKAHLYSVEKQQVSFIEIASANDENSPNETSTNHDHSTLRSRPSFSASDKAPGDKHESVRKSEISSDSGQNSSHTRALSEGHNIEINNTVNLPPHRSFHRVQRPIPPPPPPPVVTKSQSRSGSISDSTNL